MRQSHILVGVSMHHLQIKRKATLLAGQLFQVARFPGLPNSNPCYFAVALRQPQLLQDSAACVELERAAVCTKTECFLEHVRLQAVVRSSGQS